MPARSLSRINRDLNEQKGRDQYDGGDASLNDTIREDGDSAEWQDWLMDEFPDQETTLAASEEFDNRRKALSDALGVLNGRDRRIFEGRRLAEDPMTLAELADEFGVSRERVRQIEVSAFEKVQKAVKNQAVPHEKQNILIHSLSVLPKGRRRQAYNPVT